MTSFTVDSITFRQIRELVNRPYESGGNFMIDCDRKQLVPNTLTENKDAHRSIKIDRGIAEWHTHPAICQGNTCAVPFPSMDDLVNVAVGGVKGVQVHIVFAKDNNYVIQLTPQLQQQLTDYWRNQQRAEYTKVLCNIYKRLAAIYSTYKPCLKKPDKYKEFVDQSLSQAAELGIMITRVPPDQAPTVLLNVPNDSGVFRAEVDVPSDMFDGLGRCIGTPVGRN